MERKSATSDFNIFLQTWLSGVDNEVMFWNDFICSKGGEWSVDYEKRVATAPEFQYAKHEFSTWPPKVLDVGAGPISNVGIATAKGNIELSACDPLAVVYNIILKNAGINTCYCNTEFAILECLDQFYERNRFDMVCMHNALDHSFNPVHGIYQLLNVAKTGGCIKLIHSKDEAFHEAYNGFHQWNISYKEKDFIIWRHEESYNITEIFSDFAEIEFYCKDFIRHDGIKSELLYVTITKIKEVEIPHSTNMGDLTKLLILMSAFACSQYFNKLYDFTANYSHVQPNLITQIQKCRALEIAQECAANKVQLKSTRRGISEMLKRLKHIPLKLMRYWRQIVGD